MALFLYSHIASRSTIAFNMSISLLNYPKKRLFTLVLGVLKAIYLQVMKPYE